MRGRTLFYILSLILFIIVFTLLINQFLIESRQSVTTAGSEDYQDFDHPNEEVKGNTDQEIREVENEEIKLLFTGDVMLGRTVMQRSLENNDPFYPFRKVADNLSQADISFINLENPIVEDCPIHTTGFKFCTNPEVAEGLEFAGIDIVTLANNHSSNYGTQGVEQTSLILKNLGIESTGLGDLIIKVDKGIKFGFLGFDDTVSPVTEEDIIVIRDSDSKVDVLVVGVHWGEEYKDIANDRQRTLARSFIEAGADVVVGHHPHWVQDMDCFVSQNGDWEIVNIRREEFGSKSCPENAKRVYYSLGNFIFDQMWSKETRKGIVVELTFDGLSLRKEEFLPVYMENWSQPEFIIQD